MNARGRRRETHGGSAVSLDLVSTRRSAGGEATSRTVAVQVSSDVAGGVHQHGEKCCDGRECRVEALL